MMRIRKQLMMQPGARPFKDGEENWVHSYANGKVQIAISTSVQGSPFDVWFNSREAAKEAVRNIGEDTIKWYFSYNA